MYTTMNELSPMIVINIYLIIGIITTLLTYDRVTTGLAKEIEDNAYIFASLTANQLDNFIKYSPLLTILIWPVFFIGVAVGILEQLSKYFTK